MNAVLDGQVFWTEADGTVMRMGPVTGRNMDVPIAKLEAAMKALPDEVKVDLPITHHFAPGLYAREMFIPAGTALVGKQHLTEHLVFVTKGAILVADENGTKLIRAPATFVSKPGAKRAGYAVEDTIFTCVHHNPTNETDEATLEAMFVCDGLLEDQS